MYWSLENVPWTNMHDLNLDWIVNTMKQTVEQWIAYRIEMNQRYADFTEQINSDFDDFTTQINSDFDDFTAQINTWKNLITNNFNELQQYVQNYFDNLDLNESTRYVINNMIASGEFIEVLEPSISEEVTEWLAAHITPTTPVVDASLTISGAAADAKVTGDKITDNVNSIKKLNKTLEITDYYSEYAPPASEYNLGQFINNAGVVTQNSSRNYATVKYEVSNNIWERMTLKQIYVTDGNYSVVAFYNSNNVFISGLNSQTLTASTYNNNISVDIPSNTAYIIVSYAGFSSLTNNVNNTIVFGRTKTGNQTIIANGRYDNTNTYQFYLSIPNTNQTKFIAVNGIVRIPYCTINNVDFYFATYDAEYTNRQLFRHLTNVAFEGDTIKLKYNSFLGTNMPATTAAYIGIVLNIKITPPTTTTGRSAIQNMSTTPLILKNVTINNTPIDNVKYPQGPQYANFGVPKAPGYNPLEGARICCLGDSLTAVYYKTEEESWPYLIAKWNNAQVDNLGVSGCPLTQYNYEGNSISARSATLSASKYYTHIFVMAGANDYNLQAPIGENTDANNTTFKGAINYTINQLTNKFPYAKIVFATTYRRNVNYRDKEYADAMLEVCALRSIPCLNNYENSGVRFFDADWIAQFGATNESGNNHLNNAGDLFVAPRIEQALKYGVM